jgi:uncharacterized secreted repeat protein (TIGR03808 family)
MAGMPCAMSQPYVDAGAFGLKPQSDQDQSQALQMAVDAAAELRQPLYLSDGLYEVGDIIIRRPVTIVSSGGTSLRLRSGQAILTVEDCLNVVLEGLELDGGAGSNPETALLNVVNAQHIAVRNCMFSRAPGMGIRANQMEGVIEGCRLFDIGDTAIFSTDSGGLSVVRNTIGRCGNGAIRIWRSQTGSDGSRIQGNRIADIGWVGGGNGQNGNGVNVFRADEVSITDNHIANCAFSAIRLNTTNNSQVRGNYCVDSGEVSIFSEFGFSGSIISNNVIEGGAAGISMTNFDHGGRLSICQGNIVRNLAERSLTNPDTVPYGIAAEADAVVTGNIVEAVPGTGIGVGWGPYLRDVLVSDNMVRDCELGIVVSLAPGAGHAQISGNVVSGSRQHAIAGAHWRDIVSPDLPAEAHKFPHISVEGNSAA